MEYKEFKEKVMEYLVEFYGDDAQVEVTEIYKNNNVVLDGIKILIKDGDNQIVPIIYLNDLYSRYGRDGDINKAVGDIIDLRQNKSIPEDINSMCLKSFNWDTLHDHVYPGLLATKRNEALFQNLVTTPFLDLSVFYFIRLGSESLGSDSLGTIKISNDIFEKLNISKEILHEQAITNMQKERYSLQDMQDVIMKIIESEDMHDEDKVVLDNMHIESGKMYVLTNGTKTYGAAGILNKSFIKEKSNGRSLFILPSSIHEVIIIPQDNHTTQKSLDNMVCEVNNSQVAIEEQLADHSYYYDATVDEIRICA